MSSKIYKLFLGIVFLTLFFSGPVPKALADNAELQEKLNDSVVLCVGSVRAFVKDKAVLVDTTNLSVYPTVKSGRTLIPLRFVSESLGSKVAWDPKTLTVTVTQDSRTIKLIVGKREMTVDNTNLTLDVPAEIMRGRTFVPLRALAEALGKKVTYYQGFIIIGEQEIIFDPVNDKEIIDKLVARFEELGNRMDNLSNSGWIAEKNGWVYAATDEGIYKSKIDGSEKLKICGDDAWDLNVVGEWIFYVNNSDINNIYRIRNDGTQRAQLNRDEVRSTMVVRGDWIYYIKKDNQKFESHLYKMRLDGSSKMKLTDDHDSMFMYIDRNWLYFVEDSTLKRISMDGEVKKETVLPAKVYSFSIVGDWIYYSNESDELKLYKVKTDGSNEIKLSDNMSDEMLVLGDWIYYPNGLDDLKIYATKIDGTEEYRVTDKHAISLNVFNNQVVYQVVELEQ